MTTRKRSTLIGALHSGTQILLMIIMTDLSSIKDLIRIKNKLCGQSTQKEYIDGSLGMTMFIYHFNRT